MEFCEESTATGLTFQVVTQVNNPNDAEKYRYGPVAPHLEDATTS
jgi:hypothetical protein